MMTFRSAAPVLLMIVLSGACSSRAQPVPSAAVATAPAAAPDADDVEYTDAVRWAAASAERRALALQTYRAASHRLRELANGRDAGTWAIIMDADETILDNIEYEVRRARTGSPHTSGTWESWIREEAATPIPGAVDFINLVNRLGGAVVVVTNRDNHVCTPTAENLRKIGASVAAVLCRAGISNKNPRFLAVREGEIPNLPQYDVLMWIGDNIEDFPRLDQESAQSATEGELAGFGDIFWLLPNPVYGSWEGNVPQR